MSCDFHLLDTTSGCYSIQQGATLNWLTFLYPSDLTGWVPSGQIRRNYADLDSAVLASFSFEPLVYGPQTVNGTTSNYTAIRPILTAIQTASLPPTKQGLAEVEAGLIMIGGRKASVGVDAWVYDIEVASPSVVLKIARGVIQITQEVTRA